MSGQVPDKALVLCLLEMLVSEKCGVFISCLAQVLLVFVCLLVWGFISVILFGWLRVFCLFGGMCACFEFKIGNKPSLKRSYGMSRKRW